eukprot:3710443-Ditylum_brightwellii.AAC.2
MHASGALAAVTTWEWLGDSNFQIGCLESSHKFFELLANVMTHWITVPFMPPMLCYLNMSDSTSTVGWLYKSSFHSDTQYGHSALARRYAEIDMEHHLIG